MDANEPTVVRFQYEISRFIVQN